MRPLISGMGFIIILIVGLTIWAGAGLLGIESHETISPEDRIKGEFSDSPKDRIKGEFPESKSIAPPKIDIYSEIKFWSEWVGKILSALGGLGIAYKGLKSLKAGRDR